MEHVQEIFQLESLRRSLEKDLEAVTGHIDYVERSGEGVENFAVSINSPWTNSVSYGLKNDPGMAVKIMKFTKDTLEQDHAEVIAALWEYNKLVKAATHK